jgi:hypothetical protein
MLRLILCCVFVLQANAEMTEALTKWVDAAVRGDEASMTALRNLGPSGLTIVGTVFDMRIAAHEIGAAQASTSLAQWDRVFDAVGQQRMCRHSRLYWYTDLVEAKRAARESAKPILALHLLGALTDEFSCANSRFFRSTLYANQAVSELLREHFILYWWSTKPVPQIVITIDKERSLTSTITGNSVHYVLDEDGMVIDALPGLYGAGAFKDVLSEALNTADTLRTVRPDERIDLLCQWHGEQARKDERQLVELSGKGRINRDLLGNSAPAAVAITKVISERAFMKATAPARNTFARSEELQQLLAWITIARQSERSSFELDKFARNVVARQLSSSRDSAGAVNARSVHTIHALEESIAVDTVQNELGLHATIHQWMSPGAANMASLRDLGALNDKIYRDLLRTPLDDPWLGLDPLETYNGIADGGMRDRQ